VRNRTAELSQEAHWLSQTAENRVRASSAWLSSSSAEFRASTGESGYANLTHYTAEYHVSGKGPPLVLVPGLAGGCSLLGPMARLLARRFRVVTYQLRGEDDCFALRQRFGLGDLARDLRELLDFLCLERPTVFGVSFGGVVGLELAARNPHRMGSLVVQGVGARFERTLLQRVAGAVLARFPLPTDNPFVNQFFNLLFGGKPEPGPLVEFVTNQCWTTDQSVMAHRFQLVDEFDITERLRNIAIPTLILAGERDVLVSPRSLEQLRAGIDGASLVRLPGVGHLGFVTHSGRVADEVCGFVARLSDRFREGSEKIS
jgi:pimeloyl-ACP methyl ester carboxylesterase